MAADPAKLAAARACLAELGVTLADLQHDVRPALPTFDDYLPPGPRRSRSRRVARLPQLLAAHDQSLGQPSDRQHQRQRPAGHAAARHLQRPSPTQQSRRTPRWRTFIAAGRAFYNQAIGDGLIQPADSPAHRVGKPRRLPSTRRALTPDELAEINLVARTTGNDTVLDALLLRLHTETACRRAGGLGLRLQDIDVERGLLLLRENGGTVRWQPTSLDLAASLAQHAAVRGAILPTDSLLRYRNGTALTSRRYDHLWHRIGSHLPWVAVQGISMHWLRHTTLTWVERHFGYGTARAYAGHTDTTGPATTTYICADLQAVATALAAMTGQPHPLAQPIGGHRVV